MPAELDYSTKTVIAAQMKRGVMKVWATLFFVWSCTCVQAQDKFIDVRTPDNIVLAAQEWSNPKGPGVVFIDDLAQSHLLWQKQYESSLAKEFRILTYPLRGHGDSGRPLEPDMYSEGKRWGDHLRSLLSDVGFKQPSLVSWSLGGAVILNYLHTYGGRDLAVVVFVAALVGLRPESYHMLLHTLSKGNLRCKFVEVRFSGLV
jgi:non-heme chloroperoxidase